MHYCSLAQSSSVDCEIFDCDPYESFLSVFLKIYDMNLTFDEDDARIHRVLGQFESDPNVLFNDEFCFPIVIKQIRLGFGPEGGFYHRSQRLFARILMARPDNRVIAEILEASETMERNEMIAIMLITGSVPYLLEILEMRRITLSSFESILINKLRS